MEGGEEVPDAPGALLVPPASALFRLSRMSFTPSKEGAAYRVIISLASVVSRCRRSASALSATGVSARAAALAPSLTASAASISSTAGSSRMAWDFS